MPLPLANVNLDDRRWADLVEEGRALIPRHAPAWSDHNLSDPGITLMELFAWLTEQSIYRLNQVPERHRHKFLALIGYPPRPPQPAQTVLAFRPWDLDPIIIPAGSQFEAEDVQDQLVRFRTLRDLTIAAIALTAVQVDHGNGTLLDRSSDWCEGLPLVLLGDEPRPDAAFYLGFEEIPTEIPISLAFHFEGSATGPEARTRILEEFVQQRSARHPVLPDIQCDEETHETELALPAHHSARVVWEVLTDGDLWMPLEPVVAGGPPGPGQVWDHTRALTLNGIVEFNLPDSAAQASLGAVAAPLYYLRCRHEAGAYDAAPLLSNLAVNAVTAEQAVAVEHSFIISEIAAVDGPGPLAGDVACLQITADSSGVISGLTFLECESEDALEHPKLPVLRYLAPSSVASGSLTLDAVPLGFGTGLPEQVETLPQAPVQQSSITLYTHLDDRWQAWTRRDDLDASRRTDRHFTLDATTGTLRFGDGERGQAPEAGALMLARYHSTRAQAGNLRAESTFAPANTVANVPWLVSLSPEARERLREITRNPVAAAAGAAAETLAEATGRAVETVHAHERLLDLCAEHKRRTLDQVPRSRVAALAPPTRAVNLLDLERLALDVPGTRVARSRAWAGLHPSYPCLHAAGVVTLVVLPYVPAGKPEPSPGLLGAVRRYLNRRRMVTTRLEVVGPHYLAVRVIADVRTHRYVDAARVSLQIVEAIDAFLDPLGGGPDGLGWPFGRDVFRSEILQLIDGVPGVDHVLDLVLIGGEGERRCGNVTLCPTWLVCSGEHRIRVNPPTDDRAVGSLGIAPCSPAGNGGSS